MELLGARPGRTKTQLRALPGYQGLADDAFETQFQRDKDALRDAGAHMTIHAGERYSIAWDSFAPGIEVTSADRALMSLAARAWDSSEFFADAIDAKAAAASSEDVSAPMIRLGLTGLGAATTLSQAIRERRVVCFEYPGSGELTERSGPSTVPVGLGPRPQRRAYVPRLTHPLTGVLRGGAGGRIASPRGTYPSSCLFVRLSRRRRTRGLPRTDDSSRLRGRGSARGSGLASARLGACLPGRRRAGHVDRSDSPTGRRRRGHLSTDSARGRLHAPARSRRVGG